MAITSNTINQDGEITTPASEYSTVQYQDTGGTWIDIPGYTDFSLDSTDRPRRDLVAANGQPQARFGRPRVANVTVNSLGLPQTTAWRRLIDAAREGDVLVFRLITNGVAKFTSSSTNGATAAVAAATGVLTFAAGTAQTKPDVGTAQGIGIGAMVRIKTGANAYKFVMIDTISTAGAMTIVDATTFTKPADAIAANSCVIYSPPPLMWQFSGEVSGAGGFSLSAESDATTSFTITPSGHVPHAKFFTDNID